MTDNKKDILWRVYLVYLVVVLFALTIIGKVIYIQLVKGPELLKESHKKEFKYSTQTATRGNICATDGSLIATSIPIFEIRMDLGTPHVTKQIFNQNVDSLSYQLSNLFKNKSKSQYKSDLVNAREDTHRFYLLKKNVTYEQLQKLRKFPILRRGRYRGGLLVLSKTKRQMPFKNLARRTVGYHNKKNNVYVGLEGAYSDVLEGKDGKQLMRKINNGYWIPVYDENLIESKNGADIITTIDIEIQDVAQTALLRHLKEHKAYQGCAILMEVETGYIRAIANLRYDSVSRFYDESYNFAIAATVEPGSTFKLASMLALLEDKKVKLSDTVDIGNGWTTYYGSTMNDVHKIGNGRITAREAFEKSSNVGISKLITNAYKKKPKKFIDRLYDIGLNQQLGISILGEGKPSIKHPKNKENWHRTTLPWMSIGYELLLTPLQTLNFYNTIANNGRMMKPQFVEAIRKAGQLIEVFEPVAIKQKICSQRTIDTLQSLLEGVVERGTGTRLNNSVYKIAGKTGTALIAEGKKGYKDKNYNTSFVGYFPADNPKYSCIVFISRPTGKYQYGSSVAAPVFKEIADKVYSTKMDVQAKPTLANKSCKLPLYIAGKTKDFKRIMHNCNINIDSSGSNSEWGILLPEAGNTKIAQRLIKENLVPNVSGMGAKDAVFLLESAGLKTKVDGRGRVKGQSIKAGTEIKKGQLITLKLST
jgi:cell division protein FtsI (penicillin-binding protein 3)